jgi:hypothetical protein
MKEIIGRHRVFTYIFVMVIIAKDECSKVGI